MIRFLAPKFGSKVHDKDGSGRTMLHWAAARGHRDVACYIIENFKLDPQDRDKVGCYKRKPVVRCGCGK